MSRGAGWWMRLVGCLAWASGAALSGCQCQAEPVNTALPGAAAGSAVEFGVVVVGTTATRQAVLHSVGRGKLTATPRLISTSGEFRLKARDAFTVAAGTDAEVEVTYTPQDAGEDVGTVVFTTDDPDHATVEVALHGGPAAPHFVVSPDPVDFGGGDPGARVLHVDVTVTNDGAAPGIITAVDVDAVGNPAFSVDTPDLPRAVLPGTAVTVVVAYARSTSASLGSLVVLTADADAPLTVALLPSPAGACGNNTDDDGDLAVDFPSDPGCADLLDDDEADPIACDESATRPCGVETGACAPGVETCHDGVWGTCTGAVGPSTEMCDGIDNNCDNAIDEGCDDDGDGYCDTRMVRIGTPAVCPLSTDSSLVDCDDDDLKIHPGMAEICNNAVDENCDAVTQCDNCDGVDRDGDGVSACAGDCAPNDGQVFPGNTEICDGKDNDCNSSTQLNCTAGERCNHDGGGAPDPDVCTDRAICVEGLTTSGTGSGVFACASLCNQSPLGLGVGDGCASNEACAAVLNPTANLHGCRASAGIGTKAVNADCSGNTECRSGLCLDDGRYVDPTQYCSDLCTSDASCGPGMACQLGLANVPLCVRVHPAQTFHDGDACAVTPYACDHGAPSCMDVDGSGTLRCAGPCGNHGECGAGFSCMLRGPIADDPNSTGVNTVPTCVRTPAGNGGGTAGDACASNTDCLSEFCDRNAHTCVDLCSQDQQCPGAMICAMTAVMVGPTDVTNARVCLAEYPAQPLQAQ